MPEGVKILSKNRKAFFNYAVLDKIECGISLQGTEVKSMKSNHFSFVDSYARIRDDELWLIGLHVNEYTHGNIYNHVPDRARRLLAHKEEIKRLRRQVDEKGFTLVPLSFYLKDGMIKLELGVCRGKQVHDKRTTIKNRDMKRDADREMRKYR
ncbi:MAG: SsrA-binding protein SmpB [Spirochaetaceae bacterium]|nr:MAG: SsrA-binding protein SmpB [Spirochaetaceae bacterium]